MIYIIITAYGEPKATEKAINSILGQNIRQNYKIIVADPFPETKWMIEEKFKNVEYFQDPDKGKSYALNLIFRKIFSNKNDIIIMTDGDVFISNNSIKGILKQFEDPKIGVVCGKPVSLNPKNNLFGYWSNFQFYAMNKIRKNLSEKNEYFETSGYLFAVRNGIIKEFPLNCSEDSIIPALFFEKGYKISYLENAEAYVLNPQNFKDWISQRKRNIKGHLNLKKILPENLQRTKTFFNEIRRGIILSFSYIKSFNELIWMILFYFARVYVWILAYYELKFRKKSYQDGWRVEEINSTKPLD